MSATVNVNGRITADCEAVISVFAQAFLYGEGIYETMRTYAGRPFLFERHMRRLRRSAAMIELTLPFTYEERAEQIRTTQSVAKLDGEAYISVLFIRVVGEV